jgi:hypothetical protein
LCDVHFSNACCNNNNNNTRICIKDTGKVSQLFLGLLDIFVLYNCLITMSPHIPRAKTDKEWKLN